jgi:hypothetical protein
MSTGRSDVEDRLTSLFQRQAGSVPVPEVMWTEAHTMPASPALLRRRPALLGLAAVFAAAACLLVAVTLLAGDRAEQVRTVPAEETEQPEQATATTAAPASGPGGPFRAETRQVSLSADAVTIDAGARQFVTVQPVRVRSDPGTGESTSLELTWREQGVEMRLFVYFTSDGREWWSDEIRTYDGTDPGEWITYEGDFFRSPLGTPFTGDFTVTTSEPGVGRLHLANARLEAFRPAPECATATGRLVLDPGVSPITIEGFMSGYGVNVRLLDRSSCKVVADQDRYVYDWTTADSTVVTVGGHPIPLTSSLPRNAFLTPVGKGQATVHVTARDPATGAVVAETDIPVVVGDVHQLPTATSGPPPRPESG